MDNPERMARLLLLIQRITKRLDAQRLEARQSEARLSLPEPQYKRQEVPNDAQA